MKPSVQGASTRLCREIIVHSVLARPDIRLETRVTNKRNWAGIDGYQLVISLLGGGVSQLTDFFSCSLLVDTKTQISAKLSARN